MTSLIVFDAAVVVLVRAQGVARTGERYQLTCTVTENVGGAPVIAWMNSGGVIASNRSGIALGPVMTNSTASTSVLLFDPLTVGHEGNYTCQATLRAVNFSYTYSVAVVASK